MRLIFANDTATAEISVPMSTLVRDVKRNILHEHWPSSLAAVETVERLRLFAGGRELGGRDAEDLKSLKDAKLTVSPASPTPVHVQAVFKSVDSTVERDASKPSQCLCALL